MTSQRNPLPPPFPIERASTLWDVGCARCHNHRDRRSRVRRHGDPPRRAADAGGSGGRQAAPRRLAGRAVGRGEGLCLVRLRARGKAQRRRAGRQRFRTGGAGYRDLDRGRELEITWYDRRYRGGRRRSRKAARAAMASVGWSALAGAPSHKHIGGSPRAHAEAIAAEVDATQTIRLRSLWTTSRRGDARRCVRVLAGRPNSM